MSIYSGTFSASNNVIIDEEQGLSLPCSNNLVRNFHLRDQDLVGGEFIVLAGDTQLITTIRTINLDPSGEVANSRRPRISENLWWEDAGPSVDDDDDEDDDEYISQERPEAVEEVEAVNPSVSSLGSGRLRGYADMVNQSMDMENAWEMARRQPRPVEFPTQDRMVNVSEAPSRAEERFARERAAVRVADVDSPIRVTRNSNPQRRPDIHRGGRRQW